MIKAQKVDARLSDQPRQPLQQALQSSHIHTTTGYDEQSMARNELRNRAVYVEQLKALVDAKRYTVDCAALARSILAQSTFVRARLHPLACTGDCDDRPNR